MSDNPTSFRKNVPPLVEILDAANKLKERHPDLWRAWGEFLKKKVNMGYEEAVEEGSGWGSLMDVKLKEILLEKNGSEISIMYSFIKTVCSNENGVAVPNISHHLPKE